jgi:hypothetical protein
LRRRFAVLACALALVGLGLLPTAATAAPGGDSARGHVDTATYTLDFSARSTQTGLNASGNVRITLTSLDPNQVYAGDVTCLRVVGATATTPALAYIGAKVTQAPPGSPFSVILVDASDSGKFSGAPDTALPTFATGTPPPDGACPAPTPATPVADGEVVIYNTLP